MHPELLILALGALLLLVHIFAAAHVKTRQYGVTWNMGARDEELPPLNPLAGRLVRAQANFQETFPIAIVALLGVVVAGVASPMTALGGWIWLGARLVYLPLYAAGVPKVRTLVFVVSLVGLGMAIKPLFLS
ncbi:MAG: MAPEG family protein [Proteobacteria bacterium]|nr:MAPEG family protein [Pseudomonadota bacterium]